LPLQKFGNGRIWFRNFPWYPLMICEMGV
jgi:hypothetical protein